MLNLTILSLVFAPGRAVSFDWAAWTTALAASSASFWALSFFTLPISLEMSQADVSWKMSFMM